MEQSGGKLAQQPSDAGEDCLNRLPNDVLVLILLHLESTAAADARTSVLSRRWRRVWALLPELRFPFVPEPDQIASVLAAHEVDLRFLLVRTKNAAPEPVAAWLRVAARRVSGHLIFRNWLREMNSSDQGRGAFELPCLEGATAVKLDLGFLGLEVPLSSVFARLTDLSLSDIRFHGPGKLGDAVSSPRCPRLRKLSVQNARGLFHLSVQLESLLQLNLRHVDGLQELAIKAPALIELKLSRCFADNQLIADISAPMLETLGWGDAFDPSSVQLGEMAQLQQVSTHVLLVHGPGHHDSLTRLQNNNCLRFLQQFQVIHSLDISLGYHQDLSNFQYLLEDITFLPHCVTLNVILVNEGHAFGPGLYHVLRLCTGIERLLLALDNRLEAQHVCPSGCICYQPTEWMTEQLLLNCLQEVHVTDLKGSEHEVAFVKQLFNWSPVLESMKIIFDHSISKSTAMELFDTLSSFSMPETHIRGYMYRNVSKQSVSLIAVKAPS